MGKNRLFRILKKLGKEAPKFSIEKKVTIIPQSGPKCSAYAAACLLRYLGNPKNPKTLYRKFLKLPDGSAIPSSVASVCGLTLHRNGTFEDIKRLISKNIPVLVLCYYGLDADWDELHYLLVTGYDNDFVYLADSLHDEGKRYFNRIVSKEMFVKMWDTSKTMLVRTFYGGNIYFAPKGEKTNGSNN